MRLEQLSLAYYGLSSYILVEEVFYVDIDILYWFSTPSTSARYKGSYKRIRRIISMYIIWLCMSMIGCIVCLAGVIHKVFLSGVVVKFKNIVRLHCQGVKNIASS